MPDMATQHADLINALIDAAQVKPTKMGTVISRETATARAIVSFDGSSGIGQPVKCFETVVVATGDRVGMLKIEGEWIIVGNYTPRAWGDELLGVQYASVTTMTSSTFIDMPSSPTVTVAKARDATQFQIQLAVSTRVDTPSVTVEWGVLITWPDTTTADQAIFHRAINSTATHQDFYGGLTTALTLPGGTYTVTARWRRTTGTGTLTIDQNDSMMLHVKEVAP